MLSLFQRGKTFDLKQSKEDMKSQLFNILSSKEASQDVMRQLSVANKEQFGGIRSYSQLEATDDEAKIRAFNHNGKNGAKVGFNLQLLLKQNTQKNCLIC